MLRISDTRHAHDCAGYSRRDFLRVGALGVGGLTLAGLLQARAQGGDPGRALTGRSIVLLFLQGGPPHTEFFDPKMTAPAEYRSVTGEVATNLAGVTFGGTFPRLAQIADRLAVVRSYGTGNGGHTYGQVVSGGNALKAAPGAVYARLRGTNHPGTSMPTNVLLTPEAIEPALKLASNFETNAMPTLVQPGALGPSFAAFNPTGGGQLGQDMQMRIPPQRFADRRGLLDRLDRLRRRIDANGALDAVDTFQQQAFDVVTRGIADAFDLSKEDPGVIARYDTAPLFDPSRFQRYKDMGRVTNLLGRQMLLARRLIEAGCGFVTVSDCGWDMHADGKDGPSHMEGLPPMGRQVDHAVRAFLDDVRDRGLGERILLVVTGEMGRTPKLNKTGGRDHWPNLTSLLLAGGGLKMGQVIGQSDAHVAEPVTEPYRPHHLFATMMNVLFDVGQVRLAEGVPTDVNRAITEGQPIRELF